MRRLKNEGIAYLSNNDLPLLVDHVEAQLKEGYRRLKRRCEKVIEGLRRSLSRTLVTTTAPFLSTMSRPSFWPAARAIEIVRTVSTGACEGKGREGHGR